MKERLFPSSLISLHPFIVFHSSISLFTFIFLPPFRLSLKCSSSSFLHLHPSICLSSIPPSHFFPSSFNHLSFFLPFPSIRKSQGFIFYIFLLPDHYPSISPSIIHPPPHFVFFFLFTHPFTPLHHLSCLSLHPIDPSCPLHTSLRPLSSTLLFLHNRISAAF